MAVRLDKWLQVARMFKTRTQATRACVGGGVRVNGLPAKPHRLLAVGDRVELTQGDWQRILEVVEPASKPLPKTEASRVYLDLSPPRPARDPIERQLRTTAARERGLGRPTKRERRQLDRWRKERRNS